MLKVKVHIVPPQHQGKLAQHAALERARVSQERAQKNPRDEQGRFSPSTEGRNGRHRT